MPASHRSFLQIFKADAPAVAAACHEAASVIPPVDEASPLLPGRPPCTLISHINLCLEQRRTILFSPCNPVNRNFVNWRWCTTPSVDSTKSSAMMVVQTPESSASLFALRPQAISCPPAQEEPSLPSMRLSPASAHHSSGISSRLARFRTIRCMDSTPPNTSMSSSSRSAMSP